MALVYGDYKDLDPKDEHVFAYERTLGAEKYLVVLNFSGSPIAYTLPGGVKAGALLMDNYAGSEGATGTVHLKGWEARVYKE